MLDSLQRQVTQMQQAFIKSQSDNKKLWSRLVQDDYSKVESLFHTLTLYNAEPHV